VLRQALQESIVPVLVINKVDRALLELCMDKEDLYQSFCRIIENVNIVVDTYQTETMKGIILDPTVGNVAFGSGKEAWAFTLMDMAKIYEKKMGVSRDKLMKKLWGDNFWNPKTKKWTTSSTDENGKTLERGFCMFVLEPIYKIFNIFKSGGGRDAYEPMLKKLNLSLTAKEWEFTDKKLLKTVMQKFLPASDALLSMMAIHLPSPVKAQSYRCENLYEGPMDSEIAECIRKCDPEGPLMLYISKMVPTNDGGRFYAFGRVFSGTVQAGQKVRIQGPDYVPGNNKDIYKSTIQRTVLMMASKVEPIENCVAGNIIGLVGVDNYILKSATITTAEDAYNFKSMKFSVSPVVQIAIAPKDASDLPKLVEGLKKLGKSDPCIVSHASESGEFIVCGAGELHLAIALQDLEKDHAKVPIKKSNPVVPYRETVTEVSSMVALSKSPNKHNRLYMTAEPISTELCDAIDNKEVHQEMDEKIRAKYLAEHHEWDVTEARKIWAFGQASTSSNANIIVDGTKGIQNMKEIKDHVLAGFTWSANKGPLCEEPLRACKFDIKDVVLHADAIHRGAGQIMPTSRRVMYAAMLLAKPTLMEPIYLVEIVVPDTNIGGVFQCLNKRRGKIISDDLKIGTPLHSLKAYLPVAESFGFVAALRAATSGTAFATLMFSHWESLPGDVYDPDSRLHAVVKEIRARKNLKPEIPTYLDYYDKL